MLIYVKFFLHAADYADEDITDSVGDLPDADIPDPVPAEKQAASPLPKDVSPPDEEDSSSPSPSPSPSPSQAYPLPRKPARFGWRSPPPVNLTQFMRLAGGLGLAAAISSADAVTDSFGLDWKVPSERAGGDSRRMGNTRKAAEITRSAAEDFALLTFRTTSEKHAAEILSTVTNVIQLT
jgi:hypothetical protein